MSPVYLQQVDVTFNSKVLDCIEEMGANFPTNLLRALSAGDSRGFADDEDFDELDFKSKLYFQMALSYQDKVLLERKLSSGKTYHERVEEIISTSVEARVFLYITLRQHAWLTEEG